MLFTRAVDIVGGTLSGQADGNLGAVFGHGPEILIGQAARHDLHHRQLLLEDFARQIQKAHEIGNLFVADHGAKNGHIIFLHNKALRLFSVLTKWNCRSEALSLRKSAARGPLFPSVTSIYLCVTQKSMHLSLSCSILFYSHSNYLLFLFNFTNIRAF
ncbi:hypothetical protein M5E87_09665 [Flavonifractor plautii]|nr:hypothetical protein M5E87_09665 [Flavonifractor plautii]